MATQKKKPATRKRVTRQIAHTELREWINTLQILLESETIDADKTLPGGEPVMRSVWNEQEIYAIKGRIFYILDTIPSK